MTDTLDGLAVGQSATVSEITGDDGIAVRLMEMGVIEGESIRMIGRAPLGDPIEYELRGYRLSLRASEAARVQVTVNEASTTGN
ncbi:MAG: ferrous iron transport protein A [Planctomycetaceae bacterium]|nr:ferrous iron transport protein A [Planctomycetaceae bacterium]